MSEPRVYPYIPNSVERIKKEMLDEIGAASIEELYSYIPEHLRYPEKLDLPEPLSSEIELKRHVQAIMNKNTSTEELRSFLGGGAYKHFVPAICDEINARNEFISAYCGDTYSDHGKVQAIFEYTSLIGELVDMDVVGLATYDGAQALSTSLSMARRITGRKKVLLPRNLPSDQLSHFRNYSDTSVIELVDIDAQGRLCLEDLKKKLDDQCACVLLDNPSSLGVVEADPQRIADLAHEKGALFVVYADPSSLGVMEAPARYGADIVCGDIQCLGMHMGYGSGQAGYIAARDEEAYIMNFPNHFYALYENEKGEKGFYRTLNQRTSYGSREEAVEYLGTNAGLWAITAAVYLSVMGPQGMEDLGRNILLKTNYFKKRIQEVPGCRLLFPQAIHFKEIAVDFSQTGESVATIHARLFEKGILGGSLLEGLPHCALYAVTELTTKEDIDELVSSLKAILG